MAHRTASQVQALSKPGRHVAASESHAAVDSFLQGCEPDVREFFLASFREAAARNDSKGPAGAAEVVEKAQEAGWTRTSAGSSDPDVFRALLLGMSPPLTPFGTISVLPLQASLKEPGMCQFPTLWNTLVPHIRTPL